MEIYESFGQFLHEKRLERKMSYRDLASSLGLSAPYISDMEKGRRNAPSMDVLENLASYFNLSEEEKTMMFDLAGESKNEIAPDLPNYIRDNNSVVVALRTARDLGATQKDWENFVRELREKRG